MPGELEVSLGVQNHLFYLGLQVHFSHGKNLAVEGSKERADMPCWTKAAKCWAMFALKRCAKFFSKTEMALVWLALEQVGDEAIRLNAPRGYVINLKCF